MTLETINNALRMKVAPALGLDPNELSAVEFYNGIASIKLGPACYSCSGTIMALVQSIEAELKTHLPEIEIVEAVV